MRFVVVAVVVALVGLMLPHAGAQKNSEPSSTGSTTSGYEPKALIYYLHQTGDCGITSRNYHLTEENTAGDKECPEVMFPNGGYDGLLMPQSEDDFTFPAQKPIPVPIPEGKTGTFSLLLRQTPRTFFFDYAYTEMPFKVTVGKAVCEGVIRPENRYRSIQITPPVTSLKGSCTFVGSAKETDKATLDFTIKSAYTPVTILMEGETVSQFVINVITNPLTTTPPPAMPKAQPKDASLLAAPTVLLVLAALVLLTRRRE